MKKFQFVMNDPASPSFPWDAYEVRPRKDHRGFDLISEALPFGKRNKNANQHGERDCQQIHGQFVGKEILRLAEAHVAFMNVPQKIERHEVVLHLPDKIRQED
jgi:hypothetical protein